MSLSKNIKINNNKNKDFTNQVEVQKQIQEVDIRRAIADIEQVQTNIDNYNKVILNNDMELKGIEVLQDSIVVVLFRESFIKGWVENTYKNIIDVDGNLQSSKQIKIPHAAYNKVDGRTDNVGEPVYIDNPLPFLLVGKVAAISERTSKNYGLKVNDIVSVKNVPLPLYRFYPNKESELEDYVRNAKDINLNNFTGYFLFESYLVQVKYAKENLANYLRSYNKWVSE